MPFEKETEVACSAFREASDLFLKKRSEVTLKENDMGVFDVVSGNDVLVEEYIKKNISESFPNDSFFCEESGETGSSERVWVIDPIDGTVNYTRNIPIYGCQLVLLVNREPAMSVLYLPENGEMYTAVRGHGASLNGKRLDVSSMVSMHDSIVSTSDYSRGSVEFRNGQVRFMEILHDKVARFKMLGSACCDFAYFASGRTDCHIRFVRNIWDFMPGMLLAEESGGIYDKELFDKHRLLIMCSSEEALKDMSSAIRNGMNWQ